MPTLAEYEAIFDATTRAIFELPYKNKSGAMHIIALANKATIEKKNVLTEDITKAWKEGFATLKEQNDHMQQQNYYQFEGDIHRCDSNYIDDAERCEADYPLVKGRRGTGFAMCTRQAHINLKSCKDNARKKRAKTVGEITTAWKEGFAKLKAENDQMQKDLAEAFRSEMQMNSESIYDMEEALQK